MVGHDNRCIQFNFSTDRTTAFLEVTSGFTFGCFAQSVATSAFPELTSAFTFGCFAQSVATSAFPELTSAFTFGCFAQSVATSAFPELTSAFTFGCFAQSSLDFQDSLYKVSDRTHVFALYNSGDR